MKTLPELLIDQGEFLLEKRRLVAEKMALTIELQELNIRLQRTMPLPEYTKVKSLRSRIVLQIQHKDSELNKTKERQNELAAIIGVRKLQNKEGEQNWGLLRQIRDKWHSFSMDDKNHQKAREVAWKVSQEITVLIKANIEAHKNEDRES